MFTTNSAEIVEANRIFTWIYVCTCGSFLMNGYNGVSQWLIIKIVNINNNYCNNNYSYVLNKVSAVTAISKNKQKLRQQTAVAASPLHIHG